MEELNQDFDDTTDYDSERSRSNESLRYIDKYFLTYGLTAQPTYYTDIIWVNFKNSPNGKHIYIKSTEHNFDTTASFGFHDSAKISFISHFDWCRLPMKPDAYLLFSRSTKHMIVLGKSTSRFWEKSPSLNGWETHRGPYWTCPAQYWRNGHSLFEKLAPTG